MFGWGNTSLGTLPSDTTGQLDILGHDGHTLGVDGTQVGVLEKPNKVSLASFLESHDGRRLESKIGLEILGDLTHQTLEGQFPDQKLGALLVTTDFSQSDGTGPVPMWLLDTPGSWGTLTSCLGGQLLPWGLASSRFTCGLLRTSHFRIMNTGNNF